MSSLDSSAAASADGALCKPPGNYLIMPRRPPDAVIGILFSLLFFSTASASEERFDGHWWLVQPIGVKNAVLAEFMETYVDVFQTGYLNGKDDAIGAFTRLDSSDAMLRKASTVYHRRDARPPLFKLSVARYRVALDAYYRRYVAARVQPFEYPMLECLADSPEMSCARASHKLDFR